MLIPFVTCVYYRCLPVFSHCWGFICYIALRGVLCFTYDFLAFEGLSLQTLLFMLFSPLRWFSFILFYRFLLICTFDYRLFAALCHYPKGRNHVLYSCIIFKFVCFLITGVYEYSQPGGVICYLALGGSLLCYTYPRVFLFLTVVLVFSLFITGVYECSRPRGVLFVA